MSSKYSQLKARRFVITGVPNQMKQIVERDRRQRGIDESALLKSIITEHYVRNPLVIIPHFLED